MEIGLDEIEKEEVEKKKANKKQYLYAVAVLGVAGLLFAVATGIPIGAQFVAPAFNSVAYFFDGGHELNVPQATWYYFTHGGHWPGYQDWINTLMSIGLTYAMSSAIAAALCGLGVISYDTLMAVLLAFLTPEFAITIAGTLLTF